MMLSSRRDLAATALTACILGAATCPLPYIAMGALSQFALAFSLILLPPFLMGCGFLLWRYLARPAASPDGMVLRGAEILSWGGVAVFLFFISGFTLLGTPHRIGLASMLFLLTSLVCLPLVVWKDTALETRIKRRPRAVAVAALLVLLAAAGLATAAYFLVPEHLI